MAAKPAKALAANAGIDPVAHAEGLYHRFFAMVRAMEE